ncbi:MAG: thiamine pyrophosphate-binding protein, partial [Gammaproteobacteria bacterium]
MSQPTRSGGQMLVDGLLAAGVKHVFCVPGESYLAALDAFYARRADAQLIACRQEGGAAYMAEAYGKLSAQPGICFVSRGPGAANAMVGAHTAFQDSTPMLLCIGQNPREQRGREGFQELHYEDVYAGVVKRVLRIEAAGDVPGMLREAWASAIGGRPGPVALELPEDMLRERAAAADCEMPQ